LLDLIISILRLQDKDVIKVQKLTSIAFCLLSMQRLDILFDIYANAHVNIKIDIVERIVVFFKTKQIFLLDKKSSIAL
jgi:hypothetical protein